MDVTFAFGGIVALVFLLQVYLKQKADIKNLHAKYNETNFLLKKKQSEIETIKKKYNSLNEKYCQLREEHKEEINKRKVLDERLGNAVDVFKKQRREILDLKERTIALDSENEQLFNQTLLMKKDSDFNKVLKKIKAGKNVFLTGGAGTGKSYILRNLLRVLPDLAGNITSTTGISAININGLTIHSWMGIGKIDFKYDKPYTQEQRDKEITKIAKKQAKLISKNKNKLTQIQACKILAIDEISMLSDDIFVLIDKVLKILRKNECPFGGIQIVLIGDFCQLPPVIKNNFDEHNQHFVFKSRIWQDLELDIVNLTTIHRQEEDKKYAEILNDLRFGKNILKAQEYLNSCVVESKNLDFLLHIYPTNKQVDYRNTKFLNKLDSKMFEFLSADYIAEKFVTDHGDKIEIIRSAKAEELTYVNSSGQIGDKIESETKAKKNLKLKVGCKVMLIKNVDLNKGLANGTMGVVTDLCEDNITVDFANNGVHCIKKEDFEVDYDTNKNLVLLRKQFPLTLAYAITIHKSQGLTFDDAVIEISDYNRINCGQAYVALSRVKTKGGLFIIKNFPVDSIIASSDVVDFYQNIIKGAKFETN